MGMVAPCRLSVLHGAFRCAAVVPGYEARWPINSPLRSAWWPFVVGVQLRIAQGPDDVAILNQPRLAVRQSNKSDRPRHWFVLGIDGHHLSSGLAFGAAVL